MFSFLHRWWIQYVSYSWWSLQWLSYHFTLNFKNQEETQLMGFLGRVFSCWYSPWSGLQIQRLSQSSLAPHLLTQREVLTVGNPRLSDGKVMKSLTMQKDMLKMSNQHRLQPLPHFCLKHQSVLSIPIICPPCPRASMFNTKSQPWLSLFPQPETQMCVPISRKGLRNLAETVEFHRKTYWM